MKQATRFKRKLFSICLIASILALTGGCWDSHGIEQLAVVTLTGLDKISQGGMDQWQMSVLVLQPTLSASAPGSNGGSQTSSPEKAWEGTGITLLDSLNDFNKRLGKIPFFGQEKALVLGKRAFSENLKDILEVRERFGNTRPRTYVLVTNGEAYDILMTEPEGAQTLSNQVEETLTNTVETIGTSAKVTVTQLLAWLLSPDRDAVIPEIETCRPVEKRSGDMNQPQETVLIKNLAVFRAGDFAGWLNKEETTGYLLATHTVRSGQIVVPFTDQGNQLSFVISSSNYKITPQYDGQKLKFDLRVKVQGKIYDSKEVPLTSDKIKELEPEISDAVSKLIKKAVDKSQSLGADFLGFSQDLHRHNRAAWEEIQPNWRERYSEAEINVSAGCKVLNIGKGASEISPVK